MNWEYYNSDDNPPPKKVKSTRKKVVKKNDSSGAMETVDGDDNIIYFYAGVTGKENFKLNHKISHLDREMQMVAVKLGMEIPPPIHLHINSYGGSVFAAFGSIDYIMSSKTPVYTYSDAC